MASAEGPEAVIHRFAALLEAAGIPYMLTGSFASGYHDVLGQGEFSAGAAAGAGMP
jgi:hypothetical protein